MKKIFAFIILFFTISNVFSQKITILKNDVSLGTVLTITHNKSKISPISDMFLTLGYDVCQICIKGLNLNITDSLNNIFLSLKNGNYANNLSNRSYSIAADGKSAIYVAKMIKTLKNNELPQNVFLLNVEDFNKRESDSAYPIAIPPLNPTGCRLFISANSDNKIQFNSAQEYYLTWVGYDGGTAKFFTDPTKDHKKIFSENGEIIYEIPKFMNSVVNPTQKNPNPAELSIEGYDKNRHNDKNYYLKEYKYDIILIGNSILHNLEKPEYKEVNRKYFGNYMTINLATSGYRTENIIWEIEHYNFNTQRAKVCILEVGTNNVDRKNYPYRCTATEVANGIMRIVRLLRQRIPSAKIILLACFPGSYDGQYPTSHRLILEKTNNIIKQISDNRNIFYVNVNSTFLNSDLSINHDMMEDWLHPTPEATDLWLKKIEPLIKRFFE
ncbi:MAG: GDSL-type esterase/lipase family protein [Bacteroidales bacterium]|nr:GDSL-type esterase/lipase family protein [Bacteroidales bacterium]